MPEERIAKARPLSAETKKVLEKLPTPEAVTVLEEMIGRVADNNNQSNFAAAALEREEMLEKIESLPDARLRAILREHGIA